MHVAVVHNNVDQASSIGKLASWAVQTALEAGHRVTVVARDLDPALRSSVSWRHLYVPPRLHVVQWAAARKTVQLALRGVHHDVLHVYQAQLASIADTWHVAYLSRVAAETDSLRRGEAWRDRVARAQQLAVAAMEDRYLSRLSERGTKVLFCSEQVREHFLRLYGEPYRHALLYNPAFVAPLRHADRQAARRRFGLPADAFVVGYLGGVDVRKGYQELVTAVAALRPDSHLLMAGPGSEGYGDPSLGELLVSLGMVSDLEPFWHAIDLLAVPSRYDPFAMVVTEAAVRGVPVLVADTVGASTLVLKHGAGVVVEADAIASGLGRVMADPTAYRAGAACLAAEVDSRRLGQELLKHWSSS